MASGNCRRCSRPATLRGGRVPPSCLLGSITKAHAPPCSFWTIYKSVRPGSALFPPITPSSFDPFHCSPSLPSLQIRRGGSTIDGKRVSVDSGQLFGGYLARLQGLVDAGAPRYARTWSLSPTYAPPSPPQNPYGQARVVLAIRAYRVVSRVRIWAPDFLRSCGILSVAATARSTKMLMIRVSLTRS